MLEHCLIEHCAPTLAGIKSANLFSYHYRSKNIAVRELEEVNCQLNRKGVYVEALAWKERFVLVYVYRSALLAQDLQREGVRELLNKYGYTGHTVEKCLERLKERLEQYERFPHEIGIFLNYPLEDVLGFIKNKGKNYKYCGFWKVYCNECEAKKQFEKLKKCTRIYIRVFAQGRSLTQMTVSA